MTSPAILAEPSAAPPADARAMVEAGAGTASALDPRVAFLFRDALREGRFHPLLHLIARERAERGVAVSTGAGTHDAR